MKRANLRRVSPLRLAAEQGTSGTPGSAWSEVQHGDCRERFLADPSLWWASRRPNGAADIKTGDQGGLASHSMPRWGQEMDGNPQLDLQALVAFKRAGSCTHRFWKEDCWMTNWWQQQKNHCRIAALADCCKGIAI